MRRFKLAFVLLLTTMCTAGPALGQAAEWAFQVGSTWADGVADLCSDGSGHVYTTGRLGLGSAMLDGHPFPVLGSADIFFMKSTATGGYLWGTTAGGAPNPPKLYESEFGSSIEFDAETQSIVMSGEFAGSSTPTTFGPGISIEGQGAFLAKYDLQGNCLWARPVLNGGTTRTTVDHNGYITLLVSSRTWTGIQQTTFVGTPSIVLPNGLLCAKYTPQGELLWAKRLAPNAYGNVSTINGSAYMTTLFYDTDTILGTPVMDTVSSSCIARVDTGFNALQWIRQFTGPGMEILYDMGTNSDLLLTTGTSTDSLYSAWDTLVPPPGGRNFFLYALDTTGAKQWVRHMHCTGDAGSAPFVSVAPDSSIYCMFYFEGTLVAGSYTVVAESNYDVAVVRVSSDGEVIGLVTGGGYATVGGALLAAPDNGCYVGLSFQNTIELGSGFTAQGVEDAVVAKLGAITGVGELRVQGQDALHIYANPNTGTCTVDLPDALRLTDDLFLTITDATGRVVQRLPLVYTGNGVGIDIRAEARGIYHVELGDGRQRYTGTIVFQ